MYLICIAGFYWLITNEEARITEGTRVTEGTRITEGKGITEQRHFYYFSLVFPDSKHHLFIFYRRLVFVEVSLRNILLLLLQQDCF